MIEFAFAPGDWVVITFAGVGYRGRVTTCHLHKRSYINYSVEYLDDSGGFNTGTFGEDEIRKFG